MIVRAQPAISSGSNEDEDKQIFEGAETEWIGMKPNGPQMLYVHETECTQKQLIVEMAKIVGLVNEELRRDRNDYLGQLERNFLQQNVPEYHGILVGRFDPESIMLDDEVVLAGQQVPRYNNKLSQGDIKAIEYLYDPKCSRAIFGRDPIYLDSYTCSSCDSMQKTPYCFFCISHCH